MNWPLGSSFDGGPPGIRTISRTGLPLTSATRPPTWKEPMPRRTMSSSAASGGSAASVRAAAIRTRRMLFLPLSSTFLSLSAIVTDLASDRDAAVTPRAAVLGHLLEHVAQYTRRAHALGKRQPQRGAVELQFEPFRVASNAAPFPVGSAEELGGIEPHRVAVVAVHVGKNRGLGREEFGGVAGLGQNVARLKVDDAAETSDQMRGLERHPIEG